MAFFNKRMILLFTNLFLLAGIGTTIANYSTSVIQGEATESRILISNNTFENATTILSSNILPYTHSALTNYFSNPYLMRVNLNHVVTLPVGNLTSGNTNNLPTSAELVSKIYVTVSAVGNNATTSPNYTIQAIDENSNDITGVNQTIQMHNATVNSGSTAKTAADNNPKEFVLISPSISIRGFKITYSSGNGGTPGSALYRIKVEYVAISQSEVDAKNFASNFNIATDNKANCTSDSGWSTLESDYNALTVGAQNEFKTNSTNQTIIDARVRYNYLISFNNTLNDFVFGV